MTYDTDITANRTQVTDNTAKRTDGHILAALQSHWYIGITLSWTENTGTTGKTGQQRGNTLVTPRQGHSLGSQGAALNQGQRP